MAKEEIKKLVENSKKVLDADCDSFTNTIKTELESFKKKTLQKI